MSHTSLGLSDKWDIGLTLGGHIVMVTGKGRIAQDVACYERTFLGEPWFAADEGVPYQHRQLGELPPQELVISRANARARQVPGVVTATTVLTKFDGRVLEGKISVTTQEGETFYVSA